MKRSLRSWLWRVPIEDEVDEELAFHVEMRRRDGRPLTDDDIERVRRACVDIARKRDREMKLTQWLSETGSDIRFAWRQLKASPGFTAVAAVTLALGIGANSAIFALADATLLRALPFHEPDRLVMIGSQNGEAFGGISPLDSREIAATSQSFEAMGAIVGGTGGGPLITAPDGAVESAERQWVTATLFHTLGVTPIAGRTFQPSDEKSNPNVVILGEALWRGLFRGDEGIVGRDVKLNGQPFTVVGVIPDNVQFTRPARMWTMFPPPESLPPPLRRLRMMEVVGRLKPGVTLAAAHEELEIIDGRLASEAPQFHKGFRVTTAPLRDAVMGDDLQQTAMFMLAIVGFVLLMCCANIANLLLARGSSRGREFAVRAALGASRARVAAQMLTESLVLAALGGALGLALGAAILRAAPALLPPGLLPPAVVLSFDARVALFGAAAALAVGILFGLVPAWQATGTALTQAVNAETRSTTGSGSRFRSTLVAAQVAAAVLLLCGAGLLVRTLLVLVSDDTGYRAESSSVLTLDFSLEFGPNTSRPTAADLLPLYDTITRETSELPQVRSVGWTSSLPYGTREYGNWLFAIEGDPPVDPATLPSAEYVVADPGYFRTLDIPILAGRTFTDRDVLGAPAVCIVNETFVRRFLKGRNPIGLSLALRETAQQPAIVRTVVGVARQVSGIPAQEEAQAQLYAPLHQHPTTSTYMVIQPKSGPAEALTPLVRAVVARHDPNTPVRRERTLELLGVQATAGYRFRATMAGAFALLALVLAMVGVFGVLAFAVQQRRREFGVRIALGASAASVLGLVMRSGGRLIAIGTAIGLLAAVLLARMLETFLFRVEPLDPVTFVAAAVVLLITAAVATAVPAYRATRVDPVTAFRMD
jgi:putative ABC transport system permease protein